MAILTISETIDVGRVSTYLAGNNNAKGALFGKRLAAPGSMPTIAMITDALDWGNSGGAQSAESLREVANYLIWLCGSYGQQAQYILTGAGGGSVVPGGGSTDSIYPFVITSSDFESDGTSYNNPDIVGTNLTIFINEWTQQWLYSPNSFVYTSSGIQIVLDGFNANDFEYTILIQKLNNG